MSDLIFSDVMLDLETLGTAPGSVIVSIGACAFAPGMEEKEWRRFETAPISVASCQAVGLTVDKATVEWWKGQDAEARAVVVAAEAGGAACCHIVGALQGFAFWLRELPQAAGLDAHSPQAGLCGRPPGLRIWGNGSDFDNVLLGVAYAKAAVPLPWRYSRNRCFRTMKNEFGSVLEPEFQGTKHAALADAIHQARWLQSIWKYLDEKGVR
jgi:exodeoxyribonuclease VIII